MNTIDEQIAILQAYKEGKTIEYRYHDDYNGWSEWGTVKGYGDSPYHFNFANEEYRIKEEPIYEEYCKATLKDALMSKHYNLVKGKMTGSYFTIRFFDEAVVSMGSNSVTYGYLLESYVWADDGTPCGVKID